MEEFCFRAEKILDVKSGIAYQQSRIKNIVYYYFYKYTKSISELPLAKINKNLKIILLPSLWQLILFPSLGLYQDLRPRENMERSMVWVVTNEMVFVLTYFIFLFQLIHLIPF
jgi:hypothetical protein